MYKLVAIGGKLRGKEFVLEQNETVLGRDPSSDIHLNLDGVSKKHLRVTVNNDVVYLEDLGSSNGTFLNGKLIKRVTATSNDKIALPQVIFQLVYVKEKKVYVKKKLDNIQDAEEADLDYLSAESVPDSPIGKILYYFKYKFMPIFYKFNEEYEWRLIFGMLLTAFVVATIALTIFPVLSDSKKILIFETAKRGAHYADEIARLNSRALEQKNLDRLDTNFLDNEDGVSSYELFDLEGRIVRPIGKLNQYITDSFSIKSREWAIKVQKEGGKSILKTQLGNGEIGIAKMIKAYNVKLGYEEPVGIIAIRFTPRSLVLEAANNTKAYLEALTTSALVGILFFGIIYFLTIRPIDDVRRQIDLVLRGKQKEIKNKFMMVELVPLKNTINSILQMLKELQGNEDEGDFAEQEDDSSYVRTLQEFAMGAQGPVIVLNSEKNIQTINPEAEDLTGIRQSTGEGLNILDVARDQGFGATVIDLCDQSASSNGSNQSGTYELQGAEYNIYVTSLMGKDSFAKAFYVSFVKEG